jgi:hypothetical protein
LLQKSCGPSSDHYFITPVEVYNHLTQCSPATKENDMEIISVPNDVMRRKAKAMTRLNRMKWRTRLKAAAEAGATHFAFTVQYGVNLFGFRGPAGVWIETPRGRTSAPDIIEMAGPLDFQPIVLN